MKKVKVESEKVGLKLNIQKTKIMASGPITSWEIDGETGETVSIAWQRKEGSSFSTFHGRPSELARGAAGRRERGVNKQSHLLLPEPRARRLSADM